MTSSNTPIIALLFLGVWGLLTYGVIINSRYKGWPYRLGATAFTFALTALLFALAIFRIVR